MLVMGGSNLNTLQLAGNRLADIKDNKIESVCSRNSKFNTEIVICSADYNFFEQKILPKISRPSALFMRCVYSLKSPKDLDGPLADLLPQTPLPDQRAYLYLA